MCSGGRNTSKKSTARQFLRQNLVGFLQGLALAIPRLGASLVEPACNRGCRQSKGDAMTHLFTSATVVTIFTVFGGLAGCAETAKPQTVCSPHGEVPPEAKAWSPDGKQYVQPVEPRLSGRIGVFDEASNQVATIDVTQHPTGDFPNAVKAIAWDPAGQRLAVLFHQTGSRLGGVGHVSFVSVDTRAELGIVPVDRQGRCVEFSRDGATVRVDAQSINLPATTER
jgi:hypothetical protein